MFQMTNQPIEHSIEVLNLNDPAAGGLVFFEGRVRNHNLGFPVKSLEYQCYKSMANKEGSKIISRAYQLYDIKKAYCTHREGHLKIGEVAVWIGVASAHREEAFKACQYIINEVKLKVPIWKKEHYVDKAAIWVACHGCQEALHHHDSGSHHERV